MLKNHAREIISIDYFTVPTAWMKTLNVLLALSRDRRKFLGFWVTDQPSGAWAAGPAVQAGTDGPW